MSATATAVARSLRDRIPVPDGPDIDGPVASDRLPIPDRSAVSRAVPDTNTLARAGTVTAVVGLALTAVGLLVRFLLGGRETGTGTEPEPTPATDGPDLAPLIGMGTLVAMRSFVERLRRDDDRSPTDDYL